jgi:hypothetical protein
MASKVIIHMVIKINHLTENRIPATRTAGKHATNWTTSITGNVSVPTFMRLMN